MNLTKMLTVTVSTALAAMVIGAGSAQAADDGSLLSLLKLPSVTLGCFPVGQAGAGNQFTGTQNLSCSQSAQQDSSTGARGFTSYEVVSDTVECAPGSTCNITVLCPTGKKLTGGGIYVDPTTSGVHVVKSGAEPGEDNTRWAAAVFNGSTDPVDVTVQAFCANVGS
ncbi:hypothetical protein [Streptomyces sp. NPDC054838]